MNYPEVAGRLARPGAPETRIQFAVVEGDAQVIALPSGGPPLIIAATRPNALTLLRLEGEAIDFLAEDEPARSRWSVRTRRERESPWGDEELAEFLGEDVLILRDAERGIHSADIILRRANDRSARIRLVPGDVPRLACSLVRKKRGKPQLEVGPGVAIDFGGRAMWSIGPNPGTILSRIEFPQLLAQTFAALRWT